MSEVLSQVGTGGGGGGGVAPSFGIDCEFYIYFFFNSFIYTGKGIHD